MNYCKNIRAIFARLGWKPGSEWWSIVLKGYSNYLLFLFLIFVYFPGKTVHSVIVTDHSVKLFSSCSLSKRTAVLQTVMPMLLAAQKMAISTSGIWSMRQLYPASERMI